MQNREVAVLVDTSTDWARGLISGVSDYARRHPGWKLYLEPHGLGEDLRLPPGWKGDGVIARISDAAMAQELADSRLAVVNVSSIETGGPVFPSVTTDFHAIAALVVRHMQERGCGHFGYVSLAGVEYTERLQKELENAVAAVGGSYSSYALPPLQRLSMADWTRDSAGFAEWLKALPKPVVVLAWGSGRGVVDVCMQYGLKIPEEVLVLSNSDDILCRTSPIPISAVLQDTGQIGFRAAEMLDALMDGTPVAETSVQIPPVEIIERQSTYPLCVQNPVLQKAVSYIEQHAAGSITVEQVAKHACVSLRTLQRLFQDVLNYGPSSQIQMARLRRAKELLAETDWPVTWIAEHSGFCTAEYMASVFRKQLGTTPSLYRKAALRNS